MKKLFLLISLLSATCLGALSQPDLALLNAGNLLKNAGFENGKANWTASGGSFAIATGVTTRVYGNSGGSWDSSASGQTLGSTYTVSNSGGHSVQNGVGTCAVRCASGTCTHKLQVYFAGAAIAETTVTSSTTSFPRAVVNFVFPTSGDVTLRLISVNANEPTIYVDSCFLGRADAYNVFKSSVLTNALPYTPTFTGFGTPTNVEFYWARVGGHMRIHGKFVAGTTTATEARISLPDGYTSAGTALLPTLRMVGRGTYSSVGNFDNNVLIEPSVSYMTFGTQDATQSGLTKSNGNTLMSAGVTLSFFAEIPIEGWNAEADSVRADMTAQSWAGYHDNNCSFARTNAAYGDPAGDASCTFTERSNSNFGSVTSFQESGNNGAGIVFSTTQPGRYLACANTNIVMGAAAVGNVELVDGSNTRLKEGENFTNSSGHVIPMTLCGIYNASSIGSHTLKLRTKADSGSISLLANYASAVEWSVVKISENFPAPLVINSVTTPYEGVERVTRAKVSAAGAVSQESGDWINGSCAITSTSTFTCTLNSGIFSSAPVCTASIAEIGSVGFITTDSTSSTAVAKTYDTTAVATAGAFFIQCAGPR